MLYRMTFPDAFDPIRLEFLEFIKPETIWPVENGAHPELRNQLSIVSACITYVKIADEADE